MENPEILPDSQIFIPVFVSWKEAQVIARQYLIGMDFNVSQFTVKVMDISVREQAGKVYLELHTNGTYDGEISVTFRPRFYKERNKIDFEEFDLKMDTSNFFQKGIVVLLRGAIEKQLEKAMDFTLDQPIAQLLKTVNAQLKDFKATTQLKIQGEINQIELLDFTYSSKGIDLKVFAAGQLAFFIDSYYDSPLNT